MFDIEVRIGTTPGLWPASWEDVTGRLLYAPIDPNYGRSDELATDEAGTCNILLDNFDGWRDRGVAPNTAVRVMEIVDGVYRSVFYGLVESGPARWPANGNDSLVELSLADGFSVLARSDVSIQLPKQRSGERVAALLDAAGWPSVPRDVDPGVVLLDPIGEDEPASVNILSELREAARVEDGQIYVAPDGKFTFRDRHARLDMPTRAVFDVDDATAFADLDPNFDDSKLWPVARLEMADGRVVDFVDQEAADLYGDNRVHLVRDLPISIAEANAYAAWVVVRYAHPIRRFSTFTVDANLSDAAADAIRELKPGSIIRIRHRPPAGAPVDERVHVEKVSHAITADTWRASYELSPYFGEGPWSRWDETDSSVEAKWAP